MRDQVGGGGGGEIGKKVEERSTKRTIFERFE